MFDQLTSLKEGDVFYIEVPGRHLKYQINDIRVVLPNETETLNKVAGKDLATLITCTPYGVNTHRLLVTGERVPMDEETVAAESAQVKGTVLRPWMIAILIAVAIILLVSAIVWARSRKRRTEEPAQIDEAVAGTGAAAADAASVGGAASAGRVPAAAPDLLTSADQITDDEINAGRTAALRKILEERGRE